MLENSANQDIASNFGIMSTPTLPILRKGRPVGQIAGFASKEDLERGLNDILREIRAVPQSKHRTESSLHCMKNHVKRALKHKRSRYQTYNIESASHANGCK